MIVEIRYAKAKKLASTVGHTLADVKEIGPLLMKTGAKLHWNSRCRRYHLSGYSYNGSDIQPLLG